MGLILKTANDLVRILFEPGCAGCEQVLDVPLARPICDVCWRSIDPVAPPFCRICGDELRGPAGLQEECERCSRHPPHYSIARSAGRYEGALRDIVHAFKYERRRQLAEPLSELLRGAGKDLLAGADAVVPVPLHPVRSMQRGFNQADDLARQLRLPVWRVLRRRRHGPSQTSLPAPTRRRNLHAEFGLGFRAAVARRFGRSLGGTTVVLVDDVMTTGATLEACARVLMDAGAAEVRALTVARAVVGHPPRPLEPPRPYRSRH